MIGVMRRPVGPIRGRAPAVWSAAGVLVLGLVGVGLIGPTRVGASGHRRDQAPPPFQPVDRAMQRRARGAGGGATVVVHDQTVLVRHSYRGLRAGTGIPVASASAGLAA